MDTKKAYDDFFELLKHKGVLKIDDRISNILFNYIKARVHDLGLNVDINFFLKRTTTVTEPGKTTIYAHRVNPFTNENCKKEWPAGAHAFFDQEGIYVDFDLENNYREESLQGYTLIDHLIDFAFTVEHELTHVIQRDNLSSGKIDYDTLCYVRDVIALSYAENTRPEFNFYHNAHNNLFLELDANSHAESFLTRQIKERGLDSIIITDPGPNGKFFTHSVESILNRRIENAHVGPKDVPFIVDMLFGFGREQEKVELRENAEKIVSLITDSMVQLYPERYLKWYPILKYIYNSDGRRKTYYEILEEIKKQPELTEFLGLVIDNDPYLKIQKMEDMMIREYCNTKNSANRDEILKNYTTQVKLLVENENFNIDNLLIYFDKRIEQLQNIDETDEYISTARLVAMMTKQLLLKKEYLNKANAKITKMKISLPVCVQILKEKCNFNLFFDEGHKIIMINSLNSLINRYSKNHDYWIGNGLSEEELAEIIQAARLCLAFISKNGYILTEEVAKQEKVFSFAPGSDNLYGSNYYLKKVDELKDDKEELSKFKNIFEIVDEVYRQCQRNLGVTGIDMETSAYTVIGQNPLLVRILEMNPEILPMLYEIKDTEDKSDCVSRVDATIFICEELIKRQKNLG